MLFIYFNNTIDNIKLSKTLKKKDILIIHVYDENRNGMD